MYTIISIQRTHLLLSSISSTHKKYISIFKACGALVVKKMEKTAAAVAILL